MNGRTSIMAEKGFEEQAASDLERAPARASRFFEERLKDLLEAKHTGSVVAIHPESRDFEVGRNSPGARRALRQRRPEGMIVTMSFGQDRPEPALDRLLALTSVRRSDAHSDLAGRSGGE